MKRSTLKEWCSSSFNFLITYIHSYLLSFHKRVPWPSLVYIHVSILFNITPWHCFLNFRATWGQQTFYQIRICLYTQMPLLHLILNIVHNKKKYFSRYIYAIRNATCLVFLTRWPSSGLPAHPIFFSTRQIFDDGFDLQSENSGEKWKLLRRPTVNLSARRASQLHATPLWTRRPYDLEINLWYVPCIYPAAFSPNVCTYWCLSCLGFSVKKKKKKKRKSSESHSIKHIAFILPFLSSSICVMQLK